MPSPTMRDVARQAGVDPSTVSRALNETTRGMISPDTVARVLTAAQDLGYRTNTLARGLRTQRSMTIGMLIPDLTNPFFPPVVRGIEDRLARDDYTVILANTDNDEDKEHALLRTMLERQVDGLLLATSHVDHTAVEPINASRLPVVLVNRRSDDVSVSSVVPDDDAGVRAVLAHLADLGHRRVAHVAGPQDTSTGLRRAETFRAGCRGARLSTARSLVEVADAFAVDAGAEACRRLIARGAEFTAIFAANDLIAIGCLQALEEHGRSVPDDVSLVGYNDMPFVDRLRPPLTTVHVPQYVMGEQAADLILTALADPEAPPGHIELEPKLVVRGSTSAPRG